MTHQPLKTIPPHEAVTESQPVKPPSSLNRIASLLSLGPKRIMLRLYDQAVRKISGTPSWRYSRITPSLYVGGQHLNIRGMEREGITAIVNMRESHHNDIERGIGGQRHLHLATRDNTPPTLEALHQGADFIHAEIKMGGKVYIHCGVGIGRAPSMAAAYLIKYEQLSAADAIALIRKTRSFIHLTSKQFHQLEMFVESLPDEEQGKAALL